LGGGAAPLANVSLTLRSWPSRIVMKSETEQPYCGTGNLRCVVVAAFYTETARETDVSAQIDEAKLKIEAGRLANPGDGAAQPDVQYDVRQGHARQIRRAVPQVRDASCQARRTCGVKR
jgi:hypothetical protein